MLPSLLSLQMCYGICYYCIYVVLFGIFDAKTFEFNRFFSICTLLNEDDKGEREIGRINP